LRRGEGIGRRWEGGEGGVKDPLLLAYNPPYEILNKTLAVTNYSLVG